MGTSQQSCLTPSGVGTLKHQNIFLPSLLRAEICLLVCFFPSHSCMGTLWVTSPSDLRRLLFLKGEGTRLGFGSVKQWLLFSSISSALCLSYLQSFLKGLSDTLRKKIYKPGQTHFVLVARLEYVVLFHSILSCWQFSNIFN